MLDANKDGVAEAGWAVGSSGRILSYNGSTWTSVSSTGSNLHSVAIFNANDAWAVGVSGNLRHWDGSAWTTFASGGSIDYTHISVISPGTSQTQGWEQTFH
jgi:hypothetical protein